ncbi:hypothetical protein GTO10_06245 [Candidatus Saccharibacteria bacterium]|nr:hypothetical protein [Candidatus Saccharibacteria bacterium]
MPLAELYFDPQRVNPSVAAGVAHALTNWVADALSVEEEDGQLTSDDIEVRVRAKGPHDVTAYHVEITVWAKHYPTREAKLDWATARIAAELDKQIIGGVRGFVYILLSPAGFAEFEV